MPAPLRILLPLIDCISVDSPAKGQLEFVTQRTLLNKLNWVFFMPKAVVDMNNDGLRTYCRKPN